MIQNHDAFIAFAKANNYPMRCVWIKTSYEVARDRNNQRAAETGVKVPPIALAMFRKRFEEPTAAEGCEVTVVEDDGEHVLRSGMSACWPKGVANAHCLRNRSSSPVFYFVVGTRLENERCHYPDIDLHYSRKGGVRTMSHKDGTPYPGWPKGAPE